MTRLRIEDLFCEVPAAFLSNTEIDSETYESSIRKTVQSLSIDQVPIPKSFTNASQAIPESINGDPTSSKPKLLSGRPAGTAKASVPASRGARSHRPTISEFPMILLLLRLPSDHPEDVS